jgi:outer membrane protein assembly factor BamB
MDCTDVGYECRVDASDAGVCVLAFSGIELLSPDGGTYGPDASVPVLARLVRKPGFTKSAPSQAALSVDGLDAGTAMGSADEYRTTVRTTGLASGSHSVMVTVAFADAGLSAHGGFEVDAMAPGVEVVVEPRSGLPDQDPLSMSAWKLDEAALVRVTVDGGRPAELGDLTTAWAGAVSAASCTGGCTGNCRCFAVSLAGAPLAGFRGQVSLSIGAIPDAVGNQSAAQVANIDVTRFKWQRTFALGSGTSSVLPVTVGVDGTVVVTLGDAPTGAPRVVALAQDGGTLWGALTGGTMLAGPVASTTGLWVGENSPPNSQLRRVALDTGMAALGGECISSSNNFAGDLALAFTDAGVDVPLGVRGGEVQGPVAGNCRSLPLPVYPTSTTARPSLVTANVGGGLEVFIASDEASDLWKARLDGTSFSGRGGISLGSSIMPRGLFLDGAGRAGGGGALGVGSVFAVSAVGPLDAGTLTSLAANNSSAPALGADTLFYGTSSGDLIRLGYNTTTGAFTTGSSAPVGAGSLRSRLPLLGQGGRVFVVGDSGRLSARDQTSLTEHWSAILTTAPSQVTQLALDVHRGPGGALECQLPGVLYVLTRTNDIATLHAVLVDSKGLDPMARWPKYQRDNGNTGNVDRPLTPWTCP